VASFDEQIATESRLWVEEGLVSAEQAEAIRSRYVGRERSRRRDRFVRALAFVGAVGVGLGVILFFAANWDGIPEFVRLALLLGGIVGLYAAGDRLTGSRPRIGEALLLLGCLLFGASLFLVGQMFNVSTHDPLAFLVWAAAATAGAVLFRSQAFAALAVVTFGAWMGYELDEADIDEGILVALPLYGAALYAAGTRFRITVLRVLGAATVLVLLVPLTFAGVTDEIARTSPGGVGTALVIALAVAAVALAAALALDRRRPTAVWEAGACCAVVALFGVATAVDVGPLVPNVFLVALALGALAVGYSAAEPWLVSLGLVAIVVEAAIRFFDFFARIMPRSVAFLLGGALVLALAWALERNRSRLAGGTGR